MVVRTALIFAFVASTATAFLPSSIFTPNYPSTPTLTCHPTCLTMTIFDFKKRVPGDGDAINDVDNVGTQLLHKDRAEGTDAVGTMTPSTSMDSFTSSKENKVSDQVLCAALKCQKDLEKFPRVRLAHLPTPLEYCPRLSKALGGVDIYVKRDDCTGLATGGNKARKLEWLMAEAIKERADYVMTQGATQSNHCRQTAAAAAKLGIKCHILLEDRTHSTDPNYQENGNVMLDDLFGATREKRGSGLDMVAELESVAEKYRKELGVKVYTIPGGGSNPTGALGYVNCVYEMIQQFSTEGVAVDYLVHGTGSAGTQAGLVTGLRACGSEIDLLGFGVRFPKDIQEAKVFKLAQSTAEKIGLEGCVREADVVVDSSYVGEGYGIPAESTIEAIRMFAKLEGLLIDPVYSAKGAAGLIDYCRKGNFKKGDKVVFLHTGGAAALHGYINYFQK